MELTNEFHVSVPIDEAWKVLTDLERIAPCMPGAQLLEVEGDEYRGVVKVKVGPIAVQYKGVAQIIEKDDVAHRAVLRAEGRETRGQGNASATVTAVLTEVGNGTSVSIVTDLSITGKVAQFGRGLMADISGKLLGQFVTQLEADVLSGDRPDAGEEADDVLLVDSLELMDTSPETPPSRENEEPMVRTIHSDAVAPVNLLDAAGSPVAKRLAPILAIAGVFALIAWWRSRR